MAEATSITFTQLQGYAGKQEAFVTAVVSTGETITLDNATNSTISESATVTTVKHVNGQVSGTGAALTFSYAGNELTLTTTTITDQTAVIRVLYE